jgi:hypothetical protein
MILYAVYLMSPVQWRDQRLTIPNSFLPCVPIQPKNTIQYSHTNTSPVLTFTRLHLRPLTKAIANRSGQ